MVVMIVRKFNPKRKHIGLYRCPWVHKKTLPLPDIITTMEQFATWIESKFGEGRYFISGERKGFYTIFLGFIKSGKAIGRGKIKLYVAKNKEKLSNRD